MEAINIDIPKKKWGNWTSMASCGTTVNNEKLKH
jgi:hypothetical protein